jgi:glutamate carboxypeptidase
LIVQNRALLIAATALACIVAAAPAAAGLSPAEAKMAAAVDSGQEDALALLARLVNQNSGSLNIDGVTKVGVMVRAELEALGLQTRWVPMQATGRAGHLIATNAGRKGDKQILLIGHLDTVFEPDAPADPFHRDGDMAGGQGIGDDKGGVVVMLLALKAMKTAGTLKATNLEIVLTGDEERVGSPIEVARADLVAAGKRADVALDFEGLAQEGGKDMGSIARRSGNSWRLQTSGKGGHSSGIFSANAGDGAIFELARIIAVFRTQLPEPNLTFNVGLVAGGATAALDNDGVRATAAGKSNIIPAVGLAYGDFRTLSQEQTDRVRAKMQALVARHAPRTDASIEFSENYPPMAPTPGSRAYLAKLNMVNRDLGLAEMAELDPLKRGAGDIAFVAKDVDGLVGLGTGGKGAHAPGETIEIASIARQAKRAAILMSRLGAEKSLK